ncbi:hypothetical protein C8Q80DRAFT_1269979 [Daedaleopsis nitida]|nr:hypothetical protein C8Q80DRAFT_1269979 [Daedaleopsis nitida]
MSSDIISRLHDDVLRRITDCLDMGSVKSLSSTCSSLRATCMPVLFSFISIWPESIPEEGFVPASLWPYVRSLVFFGAFIPVMQPRGYVKLPPKRTPPIQFSPRYALSEALSQMPNLRTITFSGEPLFVGVPWIVLSAVLTTPQLQNIRFVGPMMMWPKQDSTRPSLKRLTLPVAPLSSFVWSPCSPYRDRPPPDYERQFFMVVLPAVSPSLEVAKLQSESVPHRVVMNHDWPRLRTLTLEGRRRTIDPSTGLTLMSILARMPRLNVLKLDLAQRVGLERQIMWPASMTRFPWPHLETLSIAYPHPDDEIYAHLPSSLHRLALRCWPRHYICSLENNRRLMERLTWYSPILTSSEMLRIVHRIRTSASASSIVELDLEFQEDEQRLELYRAIPVVFPSLTFLQIHRYRTEGVNGLPVVDIAQSLASLSCLCALRVHLDLVESPYSIINDPSEIAFSTFLKTSQEAANVFSRILSSSVVWVCILIRRGTQNEWLPYRVVRNDTPHAVLDTSVHKVESYPCKDPDAPYDDNL